MDTIRVKSTAERMWRVIVYCIQHGSKPSPSETIKVAPRTKTNITVLTKRWLYRLKTYLYVEYKSEAIMDEEEPVSFGQFITLRPKYIKRGKKLDEHARYIIRAKKVRDAVGATQRHVLDLDRKAPFCLKVQHTWRRLKTDTPWGSDQLLLIRVLRNNLEFTLSAAVDTLL